MTAPTTTLPASREIEIKFSVPDAALLAEATEIFLGACDRVKRHDSYTSYLHYYDTSDLLLRRHGVLLRTLDAAPPHFGSHIQIKTAGTAERGMLTRTEFNLASRANGLRLQDIAGHVANDLLVPAQGHAFQHWFTTITNRTERRAMFTHAGKAVMIECALDTVAFVRADTGATFRTACEIELEVKPAYSDPTLTQDEAQGALRHVAALLAARLPGLTATTASRADAGYGVLAPQDGDSRPHSADSTTARPPRRNK